MLARALERLYGARSMGPEGWIVGISAGAAAVAVLAAVVATLQARRSWPIGMKAVADDLTERVHAVESGWARLRAENAAFIEDAISTLEAVETRRRRIAAAESRTNARDQGSPPAGADGLPADPGARRDRIRQLARERGVRV